MTVLAPFCVAAVLSLLTPLTVDVQPGGETLVIRVVLEEPLPDDMSAALPTGATVRVSYPLRIRTKRRLWWDRKVWKGEAVVASTYDPVIDRYRCEVVLDGVIVSTREVETAAAAGAWLREPPPLHLAPGGLGPVEALRVRARAVFSSSTTWLIFPSTEGTEWIEVGVPDGRGGGPPAS